METVHILYKTGWQRRFASARCLMLGMLCLAPTGSLTAANPLFSTPPVRISPTHAQLTLTNCGNTNLDYRLQTSTDLTNWITDNTYHATISNRALVAFAPATADVCFYRVMTVPRGQIPTFGFAIATSSNFNANGKNFLADSFDSSNTNYSSPTNLSGFTNTVWIYDPAKQRAGGDMATGSTTPGGVNLGNGIINGHLHTGFGSAITMVQMGPHGAVGNLAWYSPTVYPPGVQDAGTATSWWLPDFAFMFPAVNAPAFPANALPAPMTTGTYSGFIVIPQPGYTNYVSNTDPGKPLYITGPVTLWVKSSLALGVTIAPTNNASLVLYVGTANGAGDSLTLSGIGTMNQPGYARNLQIYGLPSLNTVSLYRVSTIVGWTATVYTPQGDVLVGGNGNNTQDAQGAIVCRSLELKGHWHFHYDESLKANGPTY